MKSNKTLFELGLEYEAAAERIKKRISDRREKLRSLKDPYQSREAYVLNSELRTLYYEYEETRRTADYLKNYYKPNSRNALGGI